MERKRKLPARAAARVEHVAKKRTVTPPDHRSLTPTPVAAVEDPTPPPPPPLPRSIQPGKPLPTVEEPQPTDLPTKEFQTVQERQAIGVLAESLQRSRQRWISDGIFEKYWAKPSKRKGVVNEEPNNPSKDSMIKLGPVTITIEPHMFEATMFAVKDPKPPPPPPPPPSQAAIRPIVQYGPPNGTMPPPPIPTPTSIPSSPSVAAATVQSPAQTPATPQPLPPQATSQLDATKEPLASSAVPPPPTAAAVSDVSPAPLSTPVSGPSSVQAPPAISGIPVSPVPAVPAGPSFPQGMAGRPTAPPPVSTPPPRSNNTTPGPATSRPSSSAAMPGTDPIIVTLAEKATEDPQLRDLMKRVASGQAPKEELERFQAIIDQITVESRRKGVVQGPSADRLLVDGKTVRYFAEEVRAILDIVYTSNPKQTSADLRPPAGSDPLVVSLVKAALDDPKVKDMVRRIAENRPQFSDATDLKLVLDKQRSRIAREQGIPRTQSPAALSTSGLPRPNGTPSALPVSGVAGPSHPQHLPSQPSQQALRSKGPPPSSKPDISAVVFEFAGGSGDRYLFPKFSILDYPVGQQGQQVVASFLLVRKGSTTEYGGDPELDYYQPVTIRLTAHHRHLESLARVVAPQDEVRRYMDDVMDNMTRAEYVLLAMRLPRKDKEDKEPGTEKEANGTAAPAFTGELQIRYTPQMQGVLWTARPTATPPPLKPPKKMVGEDDQYQKFIASVTPRETSDV